MSESKRRILCDEDGNRLVSLSAIKALHRGHVEIPSRDALLRNIQAHLESCGDDELASELIRMRFNDLRERIVTLLEAPFGEIVRIMQDDMGFDDELDAVNFRGTGRRAAEAFFDMHPPRFLVEQGIALELRTRFPALRDFTVYDSMVASFDNVAFGLCPHHLLPIRYIIHVAYVPYDDEREVGEVVGLSKLSRAAVAIANQPILHEDVAQRIADIFHANEDSAEEEDDNGYTDSYEDPEDSAEVDRMSIRSKGAAVVVNGQHLCVCGRGATQRNATNMAMALRGVFAENSAGIKDEFLHHVAREAKLTLKF